MGLHVDREMRAGRPAPCRQSLTRQIEYKSYSALFGDRAVPTLVRSPVRAALKLYRRLPIGRHGILAVTSAHSALMFAARITVSHFSVSAATNVPNSGG